MTERQGTDASKLAWQSQPIAAPTISLTFIHHHAAKLNAQLRHETHLLYGATILGSVVALTALLMRASEMSAPMTYVTGLGVFLSIAGFILVALQARRRSRHVAIRQDESVAASLDAYRAELQRHRDYCLGSWRSLAPLVPAVAAVFIGGIWFDPRPQTGLRYTLLAVFAVVVTLLGVLHSRGKAKAFQEELDALDTLERR